MWTGETDLKISELWHGVWFVHTTLIRRPMACGGRLLRNWARTAPLLPWGRVTLPQITRWWFAFSRFGTAVLLNQIITKCASKNFVKILNKNNAIKQIGNSVFTFLLCTRSSSVFLNKTPYLSSHWRHRFSIKLCFHADYEDLACTQ